MPTVENEVITGTSAPVVGSGAVRTPRPTILRLARMAKQFSFGEVGRGVLTAPYHGAFGISIADRYK